MNRNAGAVELLTDTIDSFPGSHKPGFYCLITSNSCFVACDSAQGFGGARPGRKRPSALSGKGNRCRPPTPWPAQDGACLPVLALHPVPATASCRQPQRGHPSCPALGGHPLLPTLSSRLRRCPVSLPLPSCSLDSLGIVVVLPGRPMRAWRTQTRSCLWVCP